MTPFVLRWMSLMVCRLVNGDWILYLQRQMLVASWNHGYDCQGMYTHHRVAVDGSSNYPLYALFVVWFDVGLLPCDGGFVLWDGNCIPSLLNALLRILIISPPLRCMQPFRRDVMRPCASNRGTELSVRCPTNVFNKYLRLHATYATKFAMVLMAANKARFQ